MPAKKAESDGFSAPERAAMKERAAELRAEGKKGAKRADGLDAILEAIAKMAPEDRALAERVHVTVSATAPELSLKTWYGMPAYANADGKVVVFGLARGGACGETATVGMAAYRRHAFVRWCAAGPNGFINCDDSSIPGPLAPR